jgi:hypothetical protein
MRAFFGLGRPGVIFQLRNWSRIDGLLRQFGSRPRCERYWATRSHSWVACSPLSSKIAAIGDDLETRGYRGEGGRPQRLRSYASAKMSGEHKHSGVRLQLWTPRQASVPPSMM